MMRALQEMYNAKAARDSVENWKPRHANPDALHTNRYCDTVRLMQPLGRKESILELGCGTGGLLVALSDQFERCVGIDLSDHRIEVAKAVIEERYPAEREKFQYLTLSADEPLPFPDASFDVVLACAVLEHVVDIFAAVDELARVCKPGGHLVATVPNVAYIRHVWDLLRGRLPQTGAPTHDISYARKHGWDGGHLHYFTRGTLVALLDSAGFTTEVVTGGGAFGKLRRWYINFVGTLTVRARRR